MNLIPQKSFHFHGALKFKEKSHHVALIIKKTDFKWSNLQECIENEWFCYLIRWTFVNVANIWKSVYNKTKKWNVLCSSGVLWCEIMILAERCHYQKCKIRKEEIEFQHKYCYWQRFEQN